MGYELVAIDGVTYSHNRCTGEYEVVSGGKRRAATLTGAILRLLRRGSRSISHTQLSRSASGSI